MNDKHEAGVRILARQLARELTREELDQVSGGLESNQDLPDYSLPSCTSTESGTPQSGDCDTDSCIKQGTPFDF